MAFIHRAQFSWFLALAFIILLTLKLDGRINEWNWLIIFIPQWIFDSVVILYTTIKMIMHCRNSAVQNMYELSMKRKMWCLIVVVLKLLFQVILCLKLQYLPEVRMLYAVIPLWILLTGFVVDVFRSLWKLGRRISWVIKVICVADI